MRDRMVWSICGYSHIQSLRFICVCIWIDRDYQGGVFMEWSSTSTRIMYSHGCSDIPGVIFMYYDMHA